MSTHEGGIREPFIARWPGRIPASSVRHERAVIMDFMPTILDVAGAKLPKGYEIHGRSILSLLTGKPYERTEPFHWETENNYGVLKGDWKLVHQFWVDKPYLYNLKNDLGERTNLAEKYPEKVIEMEALHKAWVEKCYPNQLPRITKRSTGRFPKE
jgi:arylsulfatase A-like enzyme